MKFYHCFYTELPDQFVEANANRLIKWVDGWDDKNRYYQRHAVVDLVGLHVTGDARKDKYPTIDSNSFAMINNWLQTKGHLYNGRYWESLTQDKRSPARIASLSSGAIDPDDDPFETSIAAMYLAASRRASRITTGLPPTSWRLLNGMPPGGMVWMGESAPKPPLRRDAIIAGEIIGYRCWRIENGLLRSVYQPDIWLPRTALEGRELGDWDSRGIHAWKAASSEQYHDYIRSYLNSEKDYFSNMVIFGRSHMPIDKPAMLTGTVFLWGDVVEHERGYRAEYARVRSLDWLYPDETMMGKEQETLNDLRQKYGVGK